VPSANAVDLGESGLGTTFAAVFEWLDLPDRVEQRPGGRGIISITTAGGQSMMGERQAHQQALFDEFLRVCAYFAVAKSVSYQRKSWSI
jgi:hypothetical protein